MGNEEDNSKGKGKEKQGRVTVKRMLALARPETTRLVVGAVFLVVGSGMGLLYPQAIRIIIDTALDGTTGRIDLAALAMVVIFSIQSIAGGIRYFLFTVAGERIVTRLRAELYRSIIDQEIGFFDDRRTGELTNRLSSDTTVLQNTVSVNLSMGLRNLVMVVGGIALLVYTSPPLTLVMLTIVPAVALGAVLIGRRISRLSRKVQDSLAKAGEIAEETISGVRTVRAFSREPFEAGRYADAAWAAFGLARRRSLAIAWFLGVSSFAAYASVALVLWYGGRLVARSDMTVGELTSFILYTLIVAFSLSALGDLWADFMRAGGASQRVFELLDRRPLIPTRGGKTMERAYGHIELRQVGFAYPTRPDVLVLDELSTIIAPGELVALVGPSGSGKSTIASLILRLYEPSHGSVRLDGEDLRDLDPSWLRDHIGVVAQEPILFSTSIAENIRYGREGASDEEIEAAARAANAHDFVSALPEGYQTEVGERGVQLSGGQKQRVAIARALLKDPRILIFDEATSALDAESELLVREALDRLMQGRTSIVIAHRLSTVLDAHRVLVVDGGCFVQSGPHAELMQQDGVYRRLVQRQLVNAK